MRELRILTSHHTGNQESDNCFKIQMPKVQIFGSFTKIIATCLYVMQWKWKKVTLISMKNFKLGRGYQINQQKNALRNFEIIMINEHFTN